jgi:hypothetical protein
MLAAMPFCSGMSCDCQPRRRDLSSSSCSLWIHAIHAMTLAIKSHSSQPKPKSKLRPNLNTSIPVLIPKSRFQISKLSILPIEPHKNTSSLLVGLRPLKVLCPFGPRLPATTIASISTLALVFGTNAARPLRLLRLAWRRRWERRRRRDDVVRVAVNNRHVGTETAAAAGFFGFGFGFAAATATATATADDDVIRVEVIVTFVLE